MSSMQERVDDYLVFGVENIWLFDPRRKKAYWADVAGVHVPTGEALTIAAPPISLDLATLWA